MDYDPVKDRLIWLFERSVWGQRLFFGVLHLVFLRSWYVRRLLRQVLTANPRARILDAGTGFGQYTDWMARRFPEVRVTAVDIKQDYLRRLSHYLSQTRLAERVEVRFGDLVHLAEEGPFDVILSVDVMEHIEEDVTVFKNFNEVLAPGGCVIINTPSDQGGSGVHAEGEQSFIGEHVRDGYGASEIADKLTVAGLLTRKVEFGYGPVGSVAWHLLVKWPIRALGFSLLTAPLVAVYYLVAGPAGLVLNAVDLHIDNRRGTGLTVLAEKS